MNIQLNYIVISAPAGGSSIYSWDLRFRRIIQVCRDGANYDVIKTVGLSAPSGDRQVNYNSAFGRLFFKTENVFEAGGTIFIKYQ